MKISIFTGTAILIVCCACCHGGTHGWIQTNERYFTFEDGTLFIPNGDNLLMSNFVNLFSYGNEAIHPFTEAYFQEITTKGINIVRTFAENPGFNDTQIEKYLLENPYGTETEQTYNFWTLFFKLADKYDFYILMTWPSDQLVITWDNHPLNILNGGPCNSVVKDNQLTGFLDLTDNDCILAQKNRFRAIIDAIDASGHPENLMAYEIMNEINLQFGGTEIEREAYFNEMTQEVINYETAKFGKPHIISVSHNYDNPTANPSQYLFNNGYNQIINTHMYYPKVSNPDEGVHNGSRDPITPAQEVRTGLRKIMSKIPLTDIKPYIDTESGPIDYWPNHGDLPDSYDLEYYHNILWAHFSNAGSGVGLRWPFNNPFVLEIGHRQTQDAFDSISQKIDFRSKMASYLRDSTDITVTGTLIPLVVSGFGLGQNYSNPRNFMSAFIWLLQDYSVSPSTITGVDIKLNNLVDGEYQVLFLNTYTGTQIGNTNSSSLNGILQVNDIPDFEKDIAIIVNPLRIVPSMKIISFLILSLAFTCLALLFKKLNSKKRIISSVSLLFVVLTNSSSYGASFKSPLRITNNPYISDACTNGTRTVIGDSDNVFTVWVENRSSSSFIPGVYFSKFQTPNWSAPVRISLTDSIAETPSLAIDSAGNLFVVWIDSRDGNQELYFSKSTNGGVNWTSQTRLTVNDAITWYPSIKTYGVNNIRIVFVDYREGNSEIYHIKSDNAGTTFNGPFRITNDSAWSWHPDFSIDSSGNLQIIWYDTRDSLYGELYHVSVAPSGSFSNVHRITNNVYFDWFPTIDIDNSGNLHVVYTSKDPNVLRIFHISSSNNGVTWNSRTSISTDTTVRPLNPKIVIDNSKIHVAWYTQNGTTSFSNNMDVIYASSSNGGNTWSSPDTVFANTSPFISRYPNVVINSANKANVVWIGNKDGVCELYHSIEQ